MIRLDRTGVTTPDDWSERVRRSLPDLVAFEARAREFEGLDIDDPARRKGFRSYAGEVLPLVRKKREFRALWSAAKSSLRRMSWQKCSYCESLVAHARTGSVEHFRPKSLFPTLAYVWDNYFLGCGGCNGAKGDRWPAGGGSYVRPDEGEPETLFRFLADGSVEASTPGGEAERTIQDFALNEEWLREGRRRAIEWALGDLFECLRDPGVPSAVKQRLAEKTRCRLADPSCAYAAALRQCLAREWAAVLAGELP